MPEANVRRLSSAVSAGSWWRSCSRFRAQCWPRPARVAPARQRWRWHRTSGGRAAEPRRRPGARPAPVDLTGYWVSIVTEDWIERMSPDSPPSGAGGRRWSGGGGGPGRSGAAAGASERRSRAAPTAPAAACACPGRLNITWVDDNTLKIDMDAGTQTRLLHFNPTAAGSHAEDAAGLLGRHVGYRARGGGGFGGGGGGGRGGRSRRLRRAGAACESSPRT